MNTNMRNLALSVGLSAMFASSVMVAQDSAREVANVPFAFHLKNVNLPAGKYVVNSVNAAGVIRIADAKTGHSVMILTQSRTSGQREEPRLTFQRYGNDYFLSQVWMAGGSDGYSLGKTPREKELAKQPGMMATASVRIQAE